MVLHAKKPSATVTHLITSASAARLDTAGLLDAKRGYWSIEGAFHYRLDIVLDEDRSRVRTPKAALVLGLFRRLTLSFAIPWIAKQADPRAATADFQNQLKNNNARRAFLLVTTKSSKAWRTS